MAPKQTPQCAKYQYVVTAQGPKILPVPDAESKDEESAADYNSGGYLPVRVRDTFKNGRYIVLRKLGWGHFSTVWLVRDNEADRHSALKIVKSACRYAETARDEIRLCRQVMAANPLHPGRDFIVEILDSFQHVGVDESHVCMVFEPLGESLLALIERNKAKGVPRGLVKAIARQILLGLQYLHDECDLVHTDIKPENIMIAIPDVESHIRFELSSSPPPTCRRVGVPPGKSRASLSIPKKARESRQVQIFDSQPIPSPTSSRSSRSSSPGSGFRYGLCMSQIAGPPDAKSKPAPNSAADAGRTADSAPSSGSSSSSVGTSLLSCTPPTSLDSMQSKTDIPVKVVSAADKSSEASESSTDLIVESKDELKSRPANAPSLLSQTAPRNLNGSRSPSSDSTAQAHRSPTPTPPPPSPFPPPIWIKIADLGNATPSRVHFTEDIQTRQYRAPEAILGRSDWGCSADMWSVSCVIFELLTAEYLFDPQTQGELFSKDDDHMAQIIELLGDFPLDVKMGGRYSREIFDSTGALRYIKSLKPWPLKRVMTEKYLFTVRDAGALCAFLLPMLAVDFRQRAGAAEMVNHEWLFTDDEVDDWECM